MQWLDTFVTLAPKVVVPGIGDLLLTGFDYTLSIFNL
jgi:hypothetical protein